MTQTSGVAGVDGGLLSQWTFRNKIINPNFEISQRGTAFVAGTGPRFTLDRWLIDSAGSTIDASRQAFTLGQTAVPGEPAYFGRFGVISSAGVANYAMVGQRIEGVRTLAGKTAVVTFWAKADASKNIGVSLAQHFGTGGSPSAKVSVAPQTCALTTSWQKFRLNFTIPSIAGKILGTAGDFLQLYLWLDSGSDNTSQSGIGQQSGTFDFARVQIEEGPAATAFEVRPAAVEIGLCQRYFTKMRAGWSGNVTSGTAYAGFYTFPTKMRAAPVCSAAAEVSSAGFPTASTGNISSITDSDYIVSRTASSTTNGGSHYGEYSFNAEL